VVRGFVRVVLQKVHHCTEGLHFSVCNVVEYPIWLPIFYTVTLCCCCVGVECARSKCWWTLLSLPFTLLAIYSTCYLLYLLFTLLAIYSTCPLLYLPFTLLTLLAIAIYGLAVHGVYVNAFLCGIFTAVQTEYILFSHQQSYVSSLIKHLHTEFSSSYC
jgi:hypothetical protein